MTYREPEPAPTNEGQAYRIRWVENPTPVLAELIRRLKVDEVYFAYSDVKHEFVMHKASEALVAGARFGLLPPRLLQIRANKPVVAVCAVRTGCGKSQTSRRVYEILKSQGLRVVAIREPMPYGELEKQIWQRFASYQDLDNAGVTIEEREEYEPYIEQGMVIYAGCDYQEILRQAEQEADVIVWDGGNNEISFYVPDLLIVLTDPLRQEHTLSYHPGEVNLRQADVVVINKEDSATPEAINRLIALGKEQGELFWQLPLIENYRSHMKSTVADLKNIGKPMNAGTIIGGLFLSEFVPKNSNWVHIDIAGVAFTTEARDYCPAGATGVPARTLIALLVNR